jgi:pyruvate,orthophosphate dikinase
VKQLEKRSGKVFGDPSFPLLVSVRSGAAQSMPGMMDTVLNLGLNDKIAEGLIRLTKNERFVYDVYRRFVTMFADVVMGMKRELFEERIDHIKKRKGCQIGYRIDR